MDAFLDFTDKTVLITGAASGFGEMLAIELSKRGAQLVLGDINTEGLEKVAGKLGDGVACLRCDVSVEADCEALAKLAVERFGGLDIAINNAGIAQPMAKSIDTTEKIVDQQMDINVKSVVFGMKYQVPPMLEAGAGCILNVSSMAGLGGAPNSGIYAAAKHAVIGLTKTAALEYGRKGVRVNAVCPFFTPTNIGGSLLKNDEVAEQLARGCPMKRLGKVEEIIAAMVMIISPNNSYMNGQAIAIDGGVSAR